MRVRWFIEDFMLQQAQHANPAQSLDGDGLEKACTPPSSHRKPQSGVSTPTGSPIGSDDDSSSSSSGSSGRPPSPSATGRPCKPETAAAEETAAGAAEAGAADPPPSAAVIGHMMDNLLDDMEVLHPGVRDEVQQTFCALPWAQLVLLETPGK